MSPEVLLAPLADGAVGEDAQYLRRSLAAVASQDGVSSSVISESLLRVVGHDLESAAVETMAANWDGYGADPVHPASLHYACRLLSALPAFTMPPDIGVDPDGEVSLEWRNGKSVFNVSVGRHCQLSYAGMFGLNRTRGIEHLTRTVPKAIIDGIARVSNSGAPWDRQIHLHGS